MLSLWLLLLTPARACPASITQLYALFGMADRAYLGMELEDFEQAHAATRRALACASERLAPLDVAIYHRMEALSAYLERDLERASLAFQAAQAADATYDLPAEIAPQGNRLRALYDDARALPPSGTERVRGDPGVRILVDGVTASSRATQRPTVLQAVREEDGSIVGTAWVAPGDPLPPWAFDSPPEIVTEPPELPTTWLIATGGAAALAGGAWAVTGARRARGAPAPGYTAWGATAVTVGLAGVTIWQW